MFIKQADFMTRVPPELWKEIFESVCVGGNLFGLEFITPPSPQATLRLQLAHVRPALFLSSVCKHWRTIALSTPILWSNFKVFCSPHFVDFRLMDLAIQRSQTQPLTITIHGSFPCPNSTRPFRHLVTTSARWINFHFLGDGMQPDSPGYVELKRILFYEISQVPILRSIGTNTTLLSSNLPWVQSAPKLSSLALIRHDGLVPKEDYPWERITQLHLGKRFYSTRAQDVIAGVLLHCANLTKLELRDIFFGSQTLEPSSPVVLRHLAMLSIIQQERHFIRLLDSVRDEMALPALVSLELTFVGSRTSSDEEVKRSILTFISKTCNSSKLTKLRIDCSLASGPIADVLKLTTGLECLDLTLRSGGLGQNMLLDMTPQTGDRCHCRRVSVPKLRKLELSFRHDFDDPLSNTNFRLFFQMLQARSLLEHHTTCGKAFCRVSQVKISIDVLETSPFSQWVMSGDELSSFVAIRPQLPNLQMLINYRHKNHSFLF